MSASSPTVANTIRPTSSHPGPGNEETARPSVLGDSRRKSDERVEQSIKAFESFVTFVFSVSIFGASTFAIIAGQMADPVDIWSPDTPVFKLREVRTFLAIAWLCFILSLAVAGYSSSLLVIRRQQAAGIVDEAWGRAWDNIGILVSAVLHLLLVAAFLFLSLALVAYVGAIGWVAVGFSCAAGVLVLVLSTYQCLTHWDKLSI